MKQGERYVLGVRVNMFPVLSPPFDVCGGEPEKKPAGTKVEVLKDRQKLRRILVETEATPKRYAWVPADDLVTPAEWDQRGQTFAIE